MRDEIKPFNSYIQTLQKKLAAGDATEHTHRSSLETLVESLVSGITATNEPKHIECGAPDFILRKGSITVGYIEAKDVGESLDKAEKSEQLKRYRDSLTNLILTDYLEFRWYVDGEKRLSARLGSPSKDGKIRQDKDGTQEVAELLTNFLSHKAEGVGTPKELAQRMARQAHLIRNLIINAFQKEVEGGSLHTQLAAFRDNLIPDLSVEYFADMYAQTIAYGLFAARCTSKNGASFTRLDAAQNLPRTNPFLRKLFQYIAGYDLDDRISWLVDDLAQVLAQADMGAVLKDFGKHSGKEDPVVHFYETFLKEYDKIREMRGVYYTPEPVVSYIVRSIDHLLKTRFNKPQGLADDKTLILDPAVGTATFLYMVINEIHQANAGKGQQGLWNNYVAEKLLPRIFGFELLMAPYAVAHLKLGLLLQETGYEFQSDQRLGIYLTNTLEEAVKRAETLFARWISEEANAAARVKKDEPIMVVLGNPPYSGLSANLSASARELVNVYKFINGVKVKERGALQLEKNLQDDYVKFIAFGQSRIQRTGKGVLVFVTNHSYLDNLTLRGMRWSLLNTFNDIFILNLHGNAKKKEVCPDGSKDENIFDIKQGVTIGIFVKEPEKEYPAKVKYKDVWGLRDGKYDYLSNNTVESTEWTDIIPNEPNYFFVPKDETLRKEYEQCPKLDEIIQAFSIGMITARDRFVIDFEKAPLLKRVTEFQKSTLSDEELCDDLGIPVKKGWDIKNARMLIQQEKDLSAHIYPLLYRPFDIRPMFYHRSLVWSMSHPIMRNMLKHDNLALITSRMTKGETYQHTLVSNTISEVILLSPKTSNNAFVFPLYIYPSEGEMQLGSHPNFKQDFIDAISDKLKCRPSAIMRHK